MINYIILSWCTINYRFAAPTPARRAERDLGTGLRPQWWQSSKWVSWRGPGKGIAIGRARVFDPINWAPISWGSRQQHGMKWRSSSQQLGPHPPVVPTWEVKETLVLPYHMKKEQKMLAEQMHPIFTARSGNTLNPSTWDCLYDSILHKYCSQVGLI